MDDTQEMLRIAVLQQEIVWADCQANRERVWSKLESALYRMGKVDVIVVPETFTTGFGNHMADMAEMPNGETMKFAKQMARKYEALFCASWIVRDNGKNYNRMHLVAPDGEVSVYDKAHTFRVSGESEQIARGNKRMIVGWRGWRLRPVVCYDLRFPLWLRNGKDFDYDVLIVCANWPASRSEAWCTLLKARAIENLSYVVGCNRVGVDGEGGLYSGNSMAVDYKGMPMSDETFSDEGVFVVELSRDKLDKFRCRWPFNLDFDDADKLWRKD